MKFALYIDSRPSPATFYNNILLKDSFQKLGHQLDIYLPNADGQEFHGEYDLQPKEKLPQTDDYDVLIIYEDYHKGWSSKAKDMRGLLAKKFISHNKPVLCPKFDTIFEYRLLNHPVKYGVASNALRSLSDQFDYFVPPQAQSFICPVIANLSHPKPNELSWDDFCQKFDLDPTKKIIAYLPGKVSKWRDKLYNVFDLKQRNPNFVANYYQINWFLTNIEKISKTFDKLGYQLVGKLHIRDSDKFLKDQAGKKIAKKDYIKYVDQYYSRELLKYSTFALTFATTMIYQLYLYDLPVLDVGTGVYYPGWAFKETALYKPPLKAYGNGLDLISGLVVNPEQFQDKTEAYLAGFIREVENGRFTTDKFKHKKNNPLYGNSYGTTTDDIAQSILNQVS